MNKVIKGKNIAKKQKALSLRQKIDAAQKKKAKLRAEASPAPITVSPAADMTTAYTVAGFILRALVLFIGVFGMNLFFADAVELVILTGAQAEKGRSAPVFRSGRPAGRFLHNILKKK